MTDVDTLSALVERSRIILGVCPPHAATELARAVAGHRIFRCLCGRQRRVSGHRPGRPADRRGGRGVFCRRRNHRPAGPDARDDPPVSVRLRVCAGGGLLSPRPARGVCPRRPARGSFGTQDGIRGLDQGVGRPADRDPDPDHQRGSRRGADPRVGPVAGRVAQTVRPARCGPTPERRGVSAAKMEEIADTFAAAGLPGRLPPRSGRSLSADDRLQGRGASPHGRKRPRPGSWQERTAARSPPRAEPFHIRGNAGDGARRPFGESPRRSTLEP